MFSVQAFWVAKKGNSPEEFEDAFEYSQDNYRFAIADGATESSFADIWAKNLVHGFVESPIMKLERWLEPLQQTWHDSIDWDNLLWYAEEKAKAGAFSSLLGLVFLEAITDWQAIAVGDSCLFHIRSNDLLVAFPVQSAHQFGNRPLLLSSNPESNKRVWKEIQMTNGVCQPGDIFILATDALAQWFLSQYESGKKPWTTLCDLKIEEDFTRFIEELREKDLIRNDDVTLVMIHTEFNQRT